jgi:hypothetical protein
MRNFFFPYFYREFRVELREDPSSVFSSDIVIESTDGPIDFDLSRVYSGKLEGEFYLKKFSLNNMKNERKSLKI